MAHRFTSQSVTLPTTPGTLTGTLLAPIDTVPVPVVLIHPGSGPTDRDGNSRLLPGKNNSLLLLAEALAARGIASLRIDKRGIGASAGAMTAEQDLRLETYVDDAVAWLRWLRADGRFDRVVVLGHSEGALIGALAAGQFGADGYVSLAGAGERGSGILRRQLAARLPAELATENERVLTALEHGEKVDSVPPKLFMLYRPSVQPYLISWFARDPAAVVRGLAMPLLLVNGSTDIQVDSSDFGALTRARPDARALWLAGMNHVLKMVGNDQNAQVASYSDPALPLAPALVEGVATFVLGLPARAKRP
jgi:uncharacterized protein